MISNFLCQDESAARAKEDDDKRKEVAAKFQVQSCFVLKCSVVLTVYHVDAYASVRATP